MHDDEREIITAADGLQSNLDRDYLTSTMTQREYEARCRAIQSLEERAIRARLRLA